MTTDCKVTELFCIIDEFCKHFEAENAGNLLEDNGGVKRRRRAASLSDSEIMTILLYFHFGTFRNFKHYYLFFIKGTMKSYFPKAVSYNRFVELESRVFFQLMFFLNLGAFGRCTGITFVDSTRYPYAIISGDMPIRFSRELPLTEKEQWVGAMALSSTLRAMTEAR